MPLSPVNVTNELRRLTNSSVASAPTLSISQETVAGVRCVDLVYSAFKSTIEDVVYSIPAGSIRLNTADVAAPTSYYVYVVVSNHQPVVTKSPIDPTEVAGLVFARLSIIRFKSSGGVATVYYVRRTYAANSNVLFNIRNWDTQATPLYYDGGAPSVDAVSGQLSMEAMIYRRLFFQGTIPEITAGALVLSDEVTSYADLEDSTTYNDGSAITGGKYHKVLVGVITSLTKAYPFVLRRQAKPSVEYSTLDEAIIDSEHCAANSFPLAYRGMVIPLCYIAMKVGDASDIEIIDLRLTGISGGGGGGGGGVGDHSLLVNLGADDHLQYFRTDGARVMTGSIDVGNYDINNVGHIQFDTTAPAAAPVEGKMDWNPDEGTVNVGMPGGNVNLQLGQEIIRRVYNDSGADMHNGDLVYISGSTGAKLKVTLARANLAATSSPRTLYMLTEDIDNNHYGYCTFWGDVHDVNTDGIAPGTVLWLSAASAGQYTQTKPSAPNFKIKIGGVLKQGLANGIVTMSQYNGGELNDIADVNIDTPARGDMLTYRSGGYYQNLAKGAEGTYLRSGASDPAWSALQATDIALPYAMASDSTTQAIANVAAAQVVTFNTGVYASGITRTSSSRYTIVTPGVYLITFSGIAALAATPANKHLEIWLRVNGSDIANSNTRVELATVNVEMTVAVSFIQTFAAGQYFELWTWGDDTDCRWLATAAAVGPVRPAVPSVIMTVNMISRS